MFECALSMVGGKGDHPAMQLDELATHSPASDGLRLGLLHPTVRLTVDCADSELWKCHCDLYLQSQCRPSDRRTALSYKCEKKL